MCTAWDGAGFSGGELDLAVSKERPEGDAGRVEDGDVSQAVAVEVPVNQKMISVAGDLITREGDGHEPVDYVCD